MESSKEKREEERMEMKETLSAQLCTLDFKMFHDRWGHARLSESGKAIVPGAPNPIM